MKRGFFLVILFGLILVNSANAISLDQVYGTGPEDGTPILSVLKWSSADEMELGLNITIYVNITNWSDEPAYNLTIDEPKISDWAVANFTDYDAYVFTRVDSGASIYYQYTMTMVNEGNYIVEPTLIKYEDANGSRYSAFSTFLPVNVFIIPPELELGELWQNIFWLSALFVAIPTSVLLYYRYRK